MLSCRCLWFQELLEAFLILFRPHNDRLDICKSCLFQDDHHFTVWYVSLAIAMFNNVVLASCVGVYRYKHFCMRSVIAGDFPDIKWEIQLYYPVSEIFLLLLWHLQVRQLDLIFLTSFLMALPYSFSNNRPVLPVFLLNSFTYCDVLAEMNLLIVCRSQDDSSKCIWSIIWHNPRSVMPYLRA